MKITTKVSPSLIPGPFGKGGEITGTCAEEWEPVRSAFEKNFAMNMELGAQLVIYFENEMVVDLFGRSSKQDIYSAGSLQNIYSSGKNLEAVCIAVLVDRGLLSYEDFVSHHWPEFGNNGKENITVAEVLRHEGGVPFFSSYTEMEDYKKDYKLKESDFTSAEAIERVIEQAGKWNLDSKRHYHALTRGWVLSGLIRRVDPQHRTLGRFMRDEVCLPLDLDIFCGISMEEQAKYHFADVKMIPNNYLFPMLILPAKAGLGDRTVQGVLEMLFAKDSPMKRHNCTTFAKRDTEFVNSALGRSIEWPSGGMQANARSIAKLNNLLANDGSANGHRLLSPQATADLISGATIEYDHFFRTKTSFTRGGVSRLSDLSGPIMPPDSKELYEGMWGWGGRGGSLSLWDRERKVAVAYTMNGLTLQALGGPRSDRIMSALQRVLKRLVK